MRTKDALHSVLDKEARRTPSPSPHPCTGLRAKLGLKTGGCHDIYTHEIHHIPSECVIICFVRLPQVVAGVAVPVTLFF